MPAYSLDHLGDDVLLRDLAALVSRDRATTAALLAHIAEVDARRLYAAAGYPSMHAYCVSELRLSENAAYRRITAARAARRFPALFAMVADGRLHLTAVRLVAPYLTEGNTEELLAAAADLRTPALELLLARRFPPEAGFASRRSFAHLAPLSEPTSAQPVTSGPSNSSELASGRVEGDAASSESPPEVPGCYRLQVTIEQVTHDRLRYAQDLLGHAVPSGDVAQVIDRALEALIIQLEKRKFAATPRPRLRARSAPPPGARDRLVPAHVRRAVWRRDGGHCTFVGTGGHRCDSSRAIEFDHVTPVAHGGRASVENLRLRCRTHN